MPARPALYALAAVMIAASPIPSAGQQSGSVIYGVVRASDTGSPLASADLRVRGGGSSMSDSVGGFAISGLTGGSVILDVRLIGYRSWSRTINLRPGRGSHVVVTLELEPIAVNGVTARVDHDELAPGMSSFHARRRRGLGHFIDRSEINRLRPHVITDVLRQVPGVRVTPGGSESGVGDAVEMGRTMWSSGLRCPVLYFMDGLPFEISYLGIDRDVRPSEIEAIEIYTGAASIPPEFNRSSKGSSCGVVAIWSRIRHQSGGGEP